MPFFRRFNTDIFFEVLFRNAGYTNVVFFHDSKGRYLGSIMAVSGESERKETSSETSLYATKHRIEENVIEIGE